jgi:phosphate-selective porin OprO and OprP
MSFPLLRGACIAACACAPMAATAASLPFDVSPTANVQYDWAQVDSDLARVEGEEGFRRARIGFRLKDARKRWQFVAEHDFADRTPADAYLELTPREGHAFRVGQFKQPFTLDDANSDKQTAFLEASFVGAFAVSRRIGAEYARFGSRGTFNVAVFGQRLDGTSESPGASARGTWLLHKDDDSVAHVGFSIASESPQSERGSFSTTPGTAFTSLKAASTGSLSDVDRVDRAALEGLWMQGAWSLQGEAAQVIARRDGVADFHGNASSMLLTWSPGGNARVYKRGVANAPSADDGMAWELGLRWSAIDLDDDIVSGGHAESVGLAATCYVNSNMRLIANVLRVDTARRGVHDEPLVVGARLQFTY